MNTNKSADQSIIIAWDPMAEDEYGWFYRHLEEGDNLLEVAGRDADDASLIAALPERHRHASVEIIRP